VFSDSIDIELMEITHRVSVTSVADLLILSHSQSLNSY